MEKKNLKEISISDSLALTAIIDYWKDYDAKSVLLAFAELKKRDYQIPERLIKKQIAFCEKYGIENINTFTNLNFKELGFNPNEEDFIKDNIKTATEYIETHQLKATLTSINNIDGEKIIYAGQQIKRIVYIVIFIMSFFIISYIIARNLNDINEIKALYLFLLFIGIISNLIVLRLLYSAGDNLEKSVNKY